MPVTTVHPHLPLPSNQPRPPRKMGADVRPRPRLNPAPANDRPATTDLKSSPNPQPPKRNPPKHPDDESSAPLKTPTPIRPTNSTPPTSRLTLRTWSFRRKSFRASPTRQVDKARSPYYHPNPKPALPSY